MKKYFCYEKLKVFIILFTMIMIPPIQLVGYHLYLSKIISDYHILNPVYLLWLMIPFLTVFYGYGIWKKKYKMDKIDFLIFLLIIFAFISTIYSVDVDKSIYGEFERNEGLLSLLSYYLLFLNCKTITEEKQKKIVLAVVLGLGVFQVFYSILQVYTTFPFIKRFSTFWMGVGLCGNPNFFGSYMTMLVLLATTLYVTGKRKIYLFLAIIYCIGLCFAESTGPFLGVILSLLFLSIVFRKKINFKKMVILVCSFILTFIIVDITSIPSHRNKLNLNIFKSNPITGELYNTYQFLVNDQKLDNTLSKEDNIKELGSKRIGIWMDLIPAVQKYWVLGSGLDTIKDVYPQGTSANFSKNQAIDKAHNVYLQMLITNGIFALATYCILCLIIFIKGFHFKENLSIALYMAFVAYSIQAFANISVIEVAPYFFILLGLLFSCYQKEELTYSICKK